MSDKTAPEWSLDGIGVICRYGKWAIEGDFHALVAAANRRVPSKEAIAKKMRRSIEIASKNCDQPIPCFVNEGWLNNFAVDILDMFTEEREAPSEERTESDREKHIRNEAYKRGLRTAKLDAARVDLKAAKHVAEAFDVWRHRARSAEGKLKKALERLGITEFELDNGSVPPAASESAEKPKHRFGRDDLDLEIKPRPYAGRASRLETKALIEDTRGHARTLDPEVNVTFQHVCDVLTTIVDPDPEEPAQGPTLTERIGEWRQTYCENVAPGSAITAGAMRELCTILEERALARAPRGAYDAVPAFKRDVRYCLDRPKPPLVVERLSPRHPSERVEPAAQPAERISPEGESIIRALAFAHDLHEQNYHGQRPKVTDLVNHLIGRADAYLRLALQAQRADRPAHGGGK